jgi:hypothetical protein
MELPAYCGPRGPPGAARGYSSVMKWKAPMDMRSRT